MLLQKYIEAINKEPSELIFCTGLLLGLINDFLGTIQIFGATKLQQKHHTNFAA